MIKKIFLLIAVTTIFTLISNMALAVEPFFEGKTVRIIVGLSAGGGYDIYTRTIARHFGKHIPGNPTVIVDNMTGAGSMIAANYIYKAAKPDGLTIGHPNGMMFLNQIFKQPGVEFDALKYEYIGAPYQDDLVVFVAKASGVTTMEKWFNAKNPLKFGGQAPGSSFSDNVPRILRAALGLPIKPVSGYKGTAEIRLAIDSGELHGNCLSWDSGKATFGKALETGDIIPILQGVPKANHEIPNVPLAVNYAKTEEARQLIELGIHIPPSFVRPYILPPGTPKERLQILRNAFQETLKDKEFLIDLEKAKLSLNPVTGEGLEKAVGTYFRQDPALLAKLKDIIYK